MSAKTSQHLNDLTAAIQTPEPPQNPQSDEAIAYLLAFSEVSVKLSVLQAASSNRTITNAPKLSNPDAHTASANLLRSNSGKQQSANASTIPTNSVSNNAALDLRNNESAGGLSDECGLDLDNSSAELYTANEELKIRAMRHATCLLLVYHYEETNVFVGGLRALVLHQGGNSLFSSLVFQNCSGLIELFPRTIAAVLLGRSDEDQQNPVTSITLPFNSISTSLGSELDGLRIDDIQERRNCINTIGSPMNFDNSDMARDSRKDLERSWDSLLKLYRQYLGEIAHVSAGLLDYNAATTVVRELHPFGTTRLAKMLVQLIIQSAHKRSNTRSFSSRKGSANANKIHPVPDSVRNLFAPELSQLFWLDFLHAVDSSKLNGALATALVSELMRVLGTAALAVDNEELSKVVAEARMLGKVLCIVVGGGNWGVATDDEENMLRRTTTVSTSWYALIDVEQMIRKCVESGCVKTVIAAVAVADVVIRLNVHDPFVKGGDWYKRIVEAIRSVKVVTDTKEEDDMELPMPLIHVLAGDALLAATGNCNRLILDDDVTSSRYKCVLKVESSTLKSLGDDRLLELLCPSLLEVRNLALDVKRRNDRIRQIHGNGSKSTSLALKKHSSDDRAIESQPGEEHGETYGLLGEQHVQGMKRDETDDKLWHEFQRRVDVRLLHAMNLVKYSDVKDPESARSAYMTIVNKLYPCKSQTVCQVIAQKCAEIMQPKLPTGAGETNYAGEDSILSSHTDKQH